MKSCSWYFSKMVSWNLVPPRIEVSLNWSPPVNITTSAALALATIASEFASSRLWMSRMFTFLAPRNSKAFLYSEPTICGIWEAVVIISITEFSFNFDSLIIFRRIPLSKKFRFFSTFWSKSVSAKLPLFTAPPITINFPTGFIIGCKFKK